MLYTNVVPENTHKRRLVSTIHYTKVKGAAVAASKCVCRFMKQKLWGAVSATLYLACVQNKSSGRDKRLYKTYLSFRHSIPSTASISFFQKRAPYFCIMHFNIILPSTNIS